MSGYIHYTTGNDHKKVLFVLNVYFYLLISCAPVFFPGVGCGGGGDKWNGIDFLSQG